MRLTHRAVTLSITVTVPAAVGENEVETEINAALNEPPCDWGEWTVGPAIIIDVKRVPHPCGE
jgi:hypothetical protein